MDETYEEWMPECDHETVVAELGDRVTIACSTCDAKAIHAYRDMPALLLLAFVAMAGEEPFRVLERAQEAATSASEPAS